MKIRMQRFGGRPYWDGERWRCPDCNGLIKFRRPVTAGGVVCQTCGHYADRNPVRFASGRPK